MAGVAGNRGSWTPPRQPHKEWKARFRHGDDNREGSKGRAKALSWPIRRRDADQGMSAKYDMRRSDTWAAKGRLLEDE